MKKRLLAALPLLAAVSIALADDAPKASKERALEIVRKIEKDRVALAEKLDAHARSVAIRMMNDE